jgi:hypothetical protein
MTGAKLLSLEWNARGCIPNLKEELAGCQDRDLSLTTENPGRGEEEKR